MNLTGIQFYLKSTALAWMQASAANCIAEGDKFFFDVIDKPYRCYVEAAAEIIITRIFFRSELGFYEPEFADITGIHLPDGNCRAMSSGRIEADAEAMAKEYHAAAQGLKAAFTSSGKLTEFSDLTPETEGVLVKLLGNGPHFARVSGKKRPAMLCRSLFGGEQMMRPYADEFIGFTFGEKDLNALLQDAEAGDIEAMERVAIAYLKGDESLQAEPNTELAMHWFSRLAEAGSETGAYHIALLCLQGCGVPRDEQLALQWMEQAKALGSEEAYTHYDAVYDIRQLRSLSDAGDPIAAAALADAYLSLGTAMDENELLFALGIEAAKLAADADIPEAMWTLALACEHGRGMPEDPDLAIEYYKRGAELGHPACCHSLGSLYLQGDYLVGNTDKGFALCMQAAEQGYAPAMQTIGMCYQYGDGVESDIFTAVEWYEKYLALTGDAAFAQQLNHLKSIPGLVDGTDAEYVFHYTPTPEPQIPEFSMFGDSGFGGMDMGDISIGGMDTMGGVFVSDSIAAMVIFGEAEEYELELLQQGILPDAPLLDGAQALSKNAFPRVQQKAAEGDCRAASILADIDHITSMSFF